MDLRAYAMLWHILRCCAMRTLNVANFGSDPSQSVRVRSGERKVYLPCSAAREPVCVRPGVQRVADESDV